MLKEELFAKAKKACINSGNEVKYYFVGADKMIELANGAKRTISDYELSRYV